MIKVESLSRDLVDGYPDGGCHFYWEKGSDIVLIQEWEHMASGPVWGQVIPEPMYGKDLIEFITSCYDNYIITDVEENHR